MTYCFKEGKCYLIIERGVGSPEVAAVGAEVVESTLCRLNALHPSYEK